MTGPLFFHTFKIRKFIQNVFDRLFTHFKIRTQIDLNVNRDLLSIKNYKSLAFSESRNQSALLQLKLI